MKSPTVKIPFLEEPLDVKETHLSGIREGFRPGKHRLLCVNIREGGETVKKIALGADETFLTVRVQKNREASLRISDPISSASLPLSPPIWI